MVTVILTIIENGEIEQTVMFTNVTMESVRQAVDLINDSDPA